MSRPDVLIVDDDPVAADYASLALGDEGYSCRLARTGREAILAVEERVPDAVLCDFQMPEMNGPAFLNYAHARWPDIPVIMVTVESGTSDVVRMIQAGAADYLIKPVCPSVLRETVARVLLARPSRPEPAGRPAGLVWVSPAIVEIRRLIALAARSDVHVLVSGETGTGKELVARAIHAAGPRNQGPFVAQNCSAVPAELFESDFFGHVRGAFTGASAEYRGRIAAADGGTLLLDELEMLALNHQAKLLRVLEDGQVRPVGGGEIREVSFRCIAATNRNPEEMLKNGELRADLYYRLRGFEICLPPLRRRLEDIPALVEHFLDPAHDRPSTTVLAYLQGRDWPGNVRELRNALNWAVLMAGGKSLRPEHFPEPSRESQDRKGTATARTSTSLREIEIDVIQQTLARHHGNRTRAARELGIDRSTLRRRLAELGLEESS